MSFRIQAVQLPSPPSRTFFDAATFVALVVCAALAATDFWIGTNGRKRINEVLTSWWIYVESTSLAEFMRHRLRPVSEFLERRATENNDDDLDAIVSRFLIRVVLC